MPISPAGLARQVLLFPVMARKKRGQVLVVDDEPDARRAIADFLALEGFGVEMAANGYKALPKLAELDPDCVVTDLVMPGVDGLELLRRALADDPERAVIIITGHAGIESAVLAMREGAADYLAKPLDLRQLAERLDRAIARRRLRTAMGSHPRRSPAPARIDSIVGSSVAMQRAFQVVQRVAPARASVLIVGESGTGKELVASAIHERSPRADRPFVKLHCAALAEPLLESELFGHERGAFTGAAARREGRFLQADGGTLLLDEIGEISPGVQIKLLRFLQEQTFERVGGNETLHVDVRVIAATNRDLEQLVQEGAFREDLYYRLAVVSIEMPPLRARGADIALLAMHFLRKFAGENDRHVFGITDEALELIKRYPWPGNVRELENAVERAVVVTRGPRLVPEDFGPHLALLAHKSYVMPTIPGCSIEELERYAILRTLEHTGGSTSQAAALLGISPRKIQYRLAELRSFGCPADERH